MIDTNFTGHGVNLDSRMLDKILSVVDKSDMFLQYFLFLSFRRVLNVICSFLRNSPASEF